MKDSHYCIMVQCEVVRIEPSVEQHFEYHQLIFICQAPTKVSK